MSVYRDFREGKIFLSYRDDLAKTGARAAFDLIALVFNVALIIGRNFPVIHMVRTDEWIWSDNVLEIDLSVGKLQSASLLPRNNISSTNCTNPHTKTFMFLRIRSDQNGA